MEMLLSVLLMLFGSVAAIATTLVSLRPIQKTSPF